MTIEEINNLADLFTSAGRRNVPVPIEEWKELQRMAARIGKATVKDGKIKPIRKQSASQRAAGNKKASRVVKGLKANRERAKK
jgi:hypothetical protein